MTDKMNNELYIRFNFLNGIKASFDEFYNSWWNDKCLNYKNEKLSDYYDIFFSRFVTFNSLYNTIVFTKENVGLLKRKYNKKKKLIERGDKEKAVTLMSKELSDSELDKLFRTNEFICSIDVLVDILENTKFVITHKAGQQVPSDDLLILAKLKSIKNRERFLGILELLYNIRCNLFHGSKGYEHNQIILLKPINEILLHIVPLLYDSFKKLTDNLIDKTHESHGK